MAVQIKNKEYIQEYVLTSELAVFEDENTKVKSVAYPIDFPDGHHGFFTITKLVQGVWKPLEDIKSVKLEFNDPYKKNEDRTP